MESNLTSNQKSNLMTSSIDNLVINDNQNKHFQNIIVSNSKIAGKCRLYKDNVHIANIVFEK